MRNDECGMRNNSIADCEFRLRIGRGEMRSEMQTTQEVPHLPAAVAPLEKV
jgi:hypothetical protein